MFFVDLAQLLLDNKTTPLPRLRWPEEILLPTKSAGGLLGGTKNLFWEEIKHLREYTDVSADKFPESHTGSTGWEYEFIVAYVNGEVYFSDPHTSRSYDQVSAGHSLHIETEFDESNKTVRDKILLDKQQVGVNLYIGEEKIKQRNQMIEGGNMRVGFVCYIHSHPQIQVPRLDKRIYGFFSSQDIESLIKSPLHCLGLVTDRLWLVCKTSHSTMPTHRDLHAVTSTEALNPEELRSMAADTMSRYELVLYEGKFGDKLVRVN
jgi:hypothetical protein